MKISTKVVATIIVLGLLAGALIFAQYSSSTPKTVKLTAHDMEVIFQELLPPQKQQQIAADPEEKKKLVAEIRKLLAVARVAEQEGYAQHADLTSQLAFQQDIALNNAFRKKNPDAKITAVLTLRRTQPSTASRTPAAGSVRTARSTPSGSSSTLVRTLRPSISAALRPTR